MLDTVLKHLILPSKSKHNKTMSKLKHLILFCCLLFMANSGYPFNVLNHIQYGDGVSIIVIAKASYNGLDKSNSINVSLNGHCLTVSFTENLGQVTIEVSTVSGNSVHFTSTPTPNGVQCYIPNAGDYVVTFTLPNGDEYYGEFTVTE